MVSARSPPPSRLSIRPVCQSTSNPPNAAQVLQDAGLDEAAERDTAGGRRQAVDDEGGGGGERDGRDDDEDEDEDDQAANVVRAEHVQWDGGVLDAVQEQQRPERGPGAGCGDEHAVALAAPEPVLREDDEQRAGRAGGQRGEELSDGERLEQRDPAERADRFPGVRERTRDIHGRGPVGLAQPAQDHGAQGEADGVDRERRAEPDLDGEPAAPDTTLCSAGGRLWRCVPFCSARQDGMTWHTLSSPHAAGSSVRARSRRRCTSARSPLSSAMRASRSAARASRSAVTCAHGGPVCSRAAMTSVISASVSPAACAPLMKRSRSSAVSS
jgi:hypothetical protein